ncbi:MAG TPA: helicase-related protein [Gemmatimonadales bacterium]|nr:helicase-related protein [Gemmatimonadales bacterium]
MRILRDHFLPPDPNAFLAAEPATGRVVVIAPTRAACETIELAMGLDIDTLLAREHGDDIRRLASGKGFGIVAGTGTGKTLAIKPIAQTILQTPLKVGVVNREREATPETPTWNVVIVTTGIARRWFEDGLITARDTLVVDEIHQTSAELELCLALGKRAGCRFIWLSATVDPSFYARYLGSVEVLETRAFDPARAADVRVLPQQPLEFLDARFMKRVLRERRGVAVFVPTRAEVEQIAKELGDRWQGLPTAFYHGGEPIRVIRPFLDGEVRRPFLLAMTAAGQSALNIRGLDTVVIYDARYANVVQRGRNVLTRLYLGANEILQMAGRVHGRVEGGEVYILSDRDLVFDQLEPTPPEFQLAGDAERVAITCAAMGVDARDLDLPVPLDRRAYRDAVELLSERGLIEGGRLTRYGRDVEAMPVDRPWGELLCHADADLVPVVAVAANIESLHRMTREERELRGLIAPGSDHLTAYNVYAEAVNKHGYLGEVYGLPRHLFRETIDRWAEERGVLVKAIEDVALGLASVYRQLELPLPERLSHAGEKTVAAFADLVAKIMPFDLVIDEATADGREARVSRTSVCGSWGAVAGTLRYFADRFGVPRASIEGTQLSERAIRRYARRGAATVVFERQRRREGLMRVHTVSYFGFLLEREVEPLQNPFPTELAPVAREALVQALVAGETPHPDQGRVRRALERFGFYWRRSGGRLAQASTERVTDVLKDQLAGVSSWENFINTRLVLDVDAAIPERERGALEALPDSVHIYGDRVPLDYEVEQGLGVVRLRLKEGQARRLQPRDLPPFDRPIRFTVLRGKREAVRADSLDDLRRQLSGLSRGERQRLARSGRGGHGGRGKGWRR